MNDPHIVSITYEVEHGERFDYENMETFVREEESFRLETKGRRIRFIFKHHYAALEEAEESIRQYIDLWEFENGLEYGPNAFKLKQIDFDIVDRNPTPGVISPKPLKGVAKIGPLTAYLKVANYQPPPSGLSLNPDIESMYFRYMGYLEGREPLPSMAYFCLTTLELMAGSRPAAAREFKISKSVLNKIGILSEERGGRDARKAKGLKAVFTEEERRFLKLATRQIIRRAAEKLHADASGKMLQQITLSDFAQGT